MPLKACFFSTAPMSQLMQEQYSIADIRILNELGFSVTVANTFGAIPMNCDIYFSWWASGSFMPLIKAIMCRRPIIVIGGGNESQMYKDSISGEPVGYLGMNFYKKIATRLTLRYSDQIAVVSPYMKRDVRSLSGVDPIVIPNCVDTDLFSPGPGKQHYVTTIFRLDKDVVRLKRGENFIRAAKLVLREFPSQKFLMIGHKGSAYQGLVELANGLGMAEDIEFPGSIPNLEVRDWLRDSKVYVQISDTETFGVSVAEAMATGVPVVVSKCGALPDLVKQGGIFVDHNAPQSVAEGICRVLRLDREGITAVGATARAHIVENYRYEHRKVAIHAVIQHLISRKARGR